jgi:hypothetical protein
MDRICIMRYLVDVYMDLRIRLFSSHLDLSLVIIFMLLTYLLFYYYIY